MTNIARLIEELDQMPNREKFGQRHWKPKRKSKLDKRKIKDFCVDDLLKASEHELRQLFLRYDQPNLDPNVSFEVKVAKWERYQEITDAALETALENPYSFFKISKNLRRGYHLGDSIVNRVKEFKKNRKDRGRTKVYDTKYHANKEGIRELNKFLAKIPEQASVELVFSWYADSHDNPPKTSVRKSRIVSVDDVNGKDLENITVRVVSPEGAYSFKILQSGYLTAEKYHDFKEHGLEFWNY
jgi:hypothetical protein